jgi:hypothetical protein
MEHMESKLDLYKRFCALQDRGHLIVRGLKGKELEIELDRMTRIVEKTIIKVPAGWTIAKLRKLIDLHSN